MRNACSTLLCSALMMTLTGCGNGDKPNPPDGQTGGPGDPKPPGSSGEDLMTAKPDVTMSVTDWRSEFTKGGEAAAMKYTDKVIELTGKVGDIPNDAGLSLKSEKGEPPTGCNIPDVWDKVSEGVEVTVRGKINPGRLGADGYLVKAVLVKAGPNTLPSMTATEMAKAINTDYETFKGKWDKKWVYLEGEIVKVLPDAKLVLKGDGKTDVTIVPRADSKHKIQALKVGQKAKVLGEITFSSGEVTIRQSVFKGL